MTAKSLRAYWPIIKKEEKKAQEEKLRSLTIGQRIESARDELYRKWPVAVEWLRVQFLAILLFVAGVLSPMKVNGLF